MSLAHILMDVTDAVNFGLATFAAVHTVRLRGRVNRLVRRPRSRTGPQSPAP